MGSKQHALEADKMKVKWNNMGSHEADSVSHHPNTDSHSPFLRPQFMIAQPDVTRYDAPCLSRDPTRTRLMPA